MLLTARLRDGNFGHLNGTFYIFFVFKNLHVFEFHNISYISLSAVRDIYRTNLITRFSAIAMYLVAFYQI